MKSLIYYAIQTYYFEYHPILPMSAPQLPHRKENFDKHLSGNEFYNGILDDGDWVHVDCSEVIDDVIRMCNFNNAFNEQQYSTIHVLQTGMGMVMGTVEDGSQDMTKNLQYALTKLFN